MIVEFIKRIIDQTDLDDNFEKGKDKIKTVKDLL